MYRDGSAGLAGERRLCLGSQDLRENNRDLHHNIALHLREIMDSTVYPFKKAGVQLTAQGLVKVKSRGRVHDRRNATSGSVCCPALSAGGWCILGALPARLFPRAHVASDQSVSDLPSNERPPLQGQRAHLRDQAAATLHAPPPVRALLPRRAPRHMLSNQLASTRCVRPTAWLLARRRC